MKYTFLVIMSLKTLNSCNYQLTTDTQMRIIPKCYILIEISGNKD